jgi:propanediol dehydratase large subunit
MQTHDSVEEAVQIYLEKSFLGDYTEWSKSFCAHDYNKNTQKYFKKFQSPW